MQYRKVSVRALNYFWTINYLLKGGHGNRKEQF